MRNRTVHVLVAFIVAVFVLDLGKVSMAADKNMKPYDEITQEIFDKCIKTDIFEENRSRGRSEYEQGNSGEVIFKTLINTDAGKLDYMFDPQQERLEYTLTWNLPLIEGEIWSGIDYTMKECKKRCANGC